MQIKKPVSYLIDFDSTFINTEGLDVLAEASLASNPKKKLIVSAIKKLTQEGMEGRISFEESLKKRIVLLQTNKQIVKRVSTELKKQISTSILRNKNFFLSNKDSLYIISGGFKELILPVVTQFGIPSDHVYANTFLYDKKGNVIGIDESNPLSKNQGKVTVVQSLKLHNDLYIIGDGYTDFELKKLGLAKKFIAFTENVIRDNVVKHADVVAHSFDEFLFVNKLPRSLSYPKNRITVALLSKIPESEHKMLQNEGYQIREELHDDGLKKATIICGTNEAITNKLTSIEQSHALALGIYGSLVKDVTKYKDHGTAVFSGTNVAQKIQAYINTGDTKGCLTIPNLMLPKYKNSHRLLHIHKNTPGILAKINTILAENSANILGLYLKTDPEVGYAIIDIDAEYNNEVLQQLKQIPKTIRFRVLY